MKFVLKYKQQNQKKMRTRNDKKKNEENFDIFFSSVIKTICLAIGLGLGLPLLFWTYPCRISFKFTQNEHLSFAIKKNRKWARVYRWKFLQLRHDMSIMCVRWDYKIVECTRSSHRIYEQEILSKNKHLWGEEIDGEFKDFFFRIEWTIRKETN